MDKVSRQFWLHQGAKSLRDSKESGLTVVEWCKLHNVSKYQYYYRQSVMGHSNIQTTMDIYAEATNEKKPSLSKT